MKKVVVVDYDPAWPAVFDRLRDYLRTDPDIAQAYGDLKKQLADQFPHDID
ncbi:MAG TPA: hypothetical protein DIT99_04770, partial [Candidatus Latescibacteria bacterium]|nr:hypothetical protein [Candidatus Latescibacterota bacterium]